MSEDRNSSCANLEPFDALDRSNTGSAKNTPKSDIVMTDRRLAPPSVAGYQRMVARGGEAARFPFQISSEWAEEIGTALCANP